MHTKEEIKAKPDDLKDKRPYQYRSSSISKYPSPNKIFSNDFDPSQRMRNDKFNSPSKPLADIEIDSFLASSNVTFDFSKDEGKN